MYVKIQIIEIPYATEKTGLFVMVGKKNPEAPITEITIAPFPIHVQTQYPQATKNPIKSPKPSLSKSYHH